MQFSILYNRIMGSDTGRLVIISGMSGAGKSTALRCFEDLGYYCIDNLPPSLIETFVNLYHQSAGEGTGIAVVCDVRSGELFSNFGESLAQLGEAGFEPQLLFLDCEDAKLVDRFNESRRVPPLGATFRKADALKIERDLLAPLMDDATLIIDTTDLTAQQLRQRILGTFTTDGDKKAISITILSFGYKHGIPTDADFVFDTRMLPNPYYQEDLRELTGNDEQVQAFVFSDPHAVELLARTQQVVDIALENYPSVHKLHMVIAFGCTGGRHRSVSFANHLKRSLETKGLRCVVQHRDIDRA